ncbi:MAG: hypothetical protein ACJ8BW_22250 [Ktedonobacteraceae bacterium]
MSITDQGAVDTIMKDIDAIIHIAGLLVNALPSGSGPRDTQRAASKLAAQ